MRSLINKWIKPVQAEENTEQLSLLNRLNNKLQNLTDRSKWIMLSIGAITGLLLWLIILFAVHQQNNGVSDLRLTEKQRAITILSQLSDINNQLQQLASNPQNSQSFKTALTHISSALSSFQKSLNELAKTNDIQKVSSQLTSMQNDVDAQMLDLKKAIASSNDAKQYLDAKVLPFHVISIDVISQQPFVSIDYANHITPLAVGDTVAGWKITAADYDAAQVEFKNAQDQYVKIALQG